jgi:hypothetical protein
MSEFWQRLKQRKLVQWAVAYLAGAWALLQVFDLAADSYEWLVLIMRLAFALIALGFVVALLLALGGGFLWRYAQSPMGGTGSEQTRF